MNYLLMAVAISFTVGNSTLLHKFSNKGLNNTGDLFLFNGGVNAVWVVIIALFSLFSGGLHFDSTTVIFGLIYAVLLCAFLFFKMMSYATGPVSLTTLIAACSFLITTAYSVIFEKSSVSTAKIIGIIVLLGSLFLCINPKATYSEKGGKITFKWAIFTAVFFLAGGGVGILYSEFGKSTVSDNINTMMFIAALLSVIGFLALSFIVNKIAKNPSPKVDKNAVKYMLVCGVTSCVYIRLNIFLASVIPTIIFFPVSNGVSVLASSLIGWIVFKEKLNLKQIIGVLVGVIGIVIIGLF